MIKMVGRKGKKKKKKEKKCQLEKGSAWRQVKTRGTRWQIVWAGWFGL